MSLRGIRGATVASDQSADAVLTATRELLLALLDANPTLAKEDLASVLFTVTADLTAVFPARAARELGWIEVPLMDALEIPVPGSLERCIRVLALWNTDLPASQVNHVYLGAAAGLRPDLSPLFKS
jgi:chorismate mutase